MMTGEDVYAGAGVGAAPQPERSVSVHDLAHRFPGTDVLFEHLDFTAIPGQTVAICGPSGCGKSTLLSILAGWEKPYHGTVERKNVERVGWVFQNPYGVPGRTALDHVVFPLLAKGLRRREAEPQALEAMGLFDLEYAADRRFSELSGGEAQRLMLARAVCSRPDMLLVDEPTAQLDTRTAHSVSHVLGNLAGQGMIVLVATHDPDTRDACGRVIDLADYAPGDNEDSGFAPAGGNEPAEPTDPAPAGGGSREADGGGPTDSTDIAENGSEVRNIASGTAHALAMFLAGLFAGTLLGGYEAMSVMRLETEAAVRIRAFADVKTVVGGNVDGLACDRLSDHGDPSFISGAMRSGPQVVPLATKGIELSSYEVTAGMIRLITAEDPQEVPDSSGVWVSSDVSRAAACRRIMARSPWRACSIGRMTAGTCGSPMR